MTAVCNYSKCICLNKTNYYVKYSLGFCACRQTRQPLAVAAAARGRSDSGGRAAGTGALCAAGRWVEMVVSLSSLFWCLEIVLRVLRKSSDFNVFESQAEENLNRYLTN